MTFLLSLNYNNFFMTRDHLRMSHLNIVPYASSVSKSQSLAGHFAHYSLRVVVPQTQGKFFVVHIWAVHDLPPELGHLSGVLYLEFKLSLCLLDEVCVG